MKFVQCAAIAGFILSDLNNAVKALWAKTDKNPRKAIHTKTSASE